MFKKRPEFERNKWQRNLFIDKRKPDPLWLEIVGSILFALFILLICFI